MYQEANTRYDHSHQNGQLIELDCRLNRERTSCYPRPVLNDVRIM